MMHPAESALREVEQFLYDILRSFPLDAPMHTLVTLATLRDEFDRIMAKHGIEPREGSELERREGNHEETL